MSLVIANHPNKNLRPSIECLTEEIQDSRVPHIITDIKAICVVLLQYNKHFLPIDHLSKVF